MNNSLKHYPISGIFFTYVEKQKGLIKSYFLHKMCDYTTLNPNYFVSIKNSFIEILKSLREKYILAVYFATKEFWGQYRNGWGRHVYEVGKKNTALRISRSTLR